MGLSIHYKGNIRTKSSLSSLIEEVADVAKIYKWKYQILETEFPSTSLESEKFDCSLYGICFTPPECETISVCFLSNGQLSSVASWSLYENKLSSAKEILDSWVSVKTQFAGEEIHKIVIHLLDYLNKKYFDSFELNDEGEYWETRNEKVLHQKFNFLTGMINSFESTIKEMPKKAGESFEEYFKRVLKKIKSTNPPRK
jgi:hypothetical protein